MSESHCMDCGARWGTLHRSDCATFERDPVTRVNIRGSEWPEDRMDALGQNGNEGSHYATRELNPPTSSLTHSEAREAAEITGLCTDGSPCGAPPEPGDDLYCDECPNCPQSDEAPARNQPNPIDDPVNHPSHYTYGGIETIDYMRAKSTPEEYRGHLRLTALKYLSRVGHKDEALQEYKKARWYLERLIGELEQ